jgi:hypothetical protein
MAKNLVIVESPAKAKTIEGYLGKDFVVKSSFGHVRDLAKKGLAIDLENGYIYKLGNLSAETIFFFTVLIHIVFQALSCDWSITLIEALNKAIRVQLVLALESLESLDILIERLNGSFEVGFDCVIGIPKPDVFIWKELLVSGIFWLSLGLFSRSKRCFEHLLTVGFEKMAKKNWL